MKIIPAILEKDFDSVQKNIDLFSKISVSLQIDVCDGIFVENKTWKPNPFEDINGYLLDLEFDMMVEDVTKYLDFLSIYDAKKIVVHTEKISAEDYKKIFIKIKDKNSLIEVGICDRDIEKIKSCVGMYDYVQLMGIEHMGVQGQEFDEKVIERIEKLREFFDTKEMEKESKKVKEDSDKSLEDIKNQNNNLNKFIIQIDGSMNPETILRCKNAGANSFVVGSYLKKGIEENRLKEVFMELKQV